MIENSSGSSKVKVRGIIASVSLNPTVLFLAQSSYGSDYGTGFIHVEATNEEGEAVDIFEWVLYPDVDWISFDDNSSKLIISPPSSLVGGGYYFKLTLFSENDFYVDTYTSTYTSSSFGVILSSYAPTPTPE